MESYIERQLKKTNLFYQMDTTHFCSRRWDTWGWREHLASSKTNYFGKECMSMLNTVTKECKCLKKKKPKKQTRAPLNNKSINSFEVVPVDFLNLETCKQGYEYILVMMGHYTRFAQACPTENKAAKTVPEKIFALKLCSPRKIHHDMEKESENQLLTRLDLNGVRGSHNPLYHPEGNGLVQRVNRMLLSILRT